MHLRPTAGLVFGQLVLVAHDLGCCRTTGLGGQPGQLEQVPLDEPLEAEEHLSGVAGEHERRHRVEPVLGRDLERGVKRHREAELVPVHEAGGLGGGVLRDTHDTKSLGRERTVQPLHQGRRQIARGAIVLEEEEQGRRRG